MTFHCRYCQQPQSDRLYFASFLTPDDRSQTGFLCYSCHDALKDQGRIIGYVSSKGGGAQWIAKLFALRSLHDQYPDPQFDFKSIQRIQKDIPLPPLRGVHDLIDRMADAYCWLATAHGGLRTFEGWLFGTSGRQLKLMLEGENLQIRGRAHRQRHKSILNLHDAVIQAARKRRRNDVIRNLVGVVAASFSGRFQVANLEKGRQRLATYAFLTSLAARSPRSLGAYKSLEAIQTGDPWVVVLATRVGHVRRATVSRVCELLMHAMDHDEPHRYEVALRTLHWDVLVERCLEMTSLTP